MANDSQYQAAIENDNENHSQAAGTEKPQSWETGETGALASQPETLSIF
jgi:hypothetical protein